MDSTGLLSIIAKPLIDEIVKLYVTPKLKKLADRLEAKKLKKDLSLSQFIENKFEEYLTRIAAEASVINLLAFPNQQVKLTDIYYPLTIRSNKNDCSYLMNCMEKGMIDRFRKILIKDTAGMGKSTLLKFMTLEIIKHRYGIPVIINLRNLKKDHSPWDNLLLQLNELSELFDEKLLQEFVRPGDFIFLLDGFDEIQEEDYKAIIYKLRLFIDFVHKNHIILTSRPDPSLSSLGDFQGFFVQPLALKDTYELIRIYDRYSRNDLADRIIKEIPPKKEQLGSFLENPFLICLLYETYCYTNHIPNEKITFYDEVYRGLFVRLDLTKDGMTRRKKSGLGIITFRLVLRQLAFDTVKKNLVSYTKRELLELIREAKQKVKVADFAEDLFLEDLLLAVPLFCEEGIKVKWTHKSFQDYFAAEKLQSDDNKSQKLLKICELKKSNYMNVLDLYAEVDPTTFRHVIVKKVVEDYLSSIESCYPDFDHIDSDAIMERKTILAMISGSIYLAYCDLNLPDRSTRLQGILLKIYEQEKGKGVLMTELSNGAVCAYVADEFPRKLLELAAKSEPAVIQFNYSRKPIEIDLRRQKELLGFEPQKINDDKDHPFNMPGNFELINQCLASLLKKFTILEQPYSIDHNGMKTVLQEINKELAKLDSDV